MGIKYIACMHVYCMYYKKRGLDKILIVEISLRIAKFLVVSDFYLKGFKRYD